MATITYPNRAVAGLARPDVSVARFIEFEVDFSKITAAVGDVINIGKVNAGTFIIGEMTQVLVAGTASATVALTVSGTAIGTATSIAATAGTITSVATPVGITAAGDVALTVAGAAPTSGKFRVVLLVSEMIKRDYPQTVVRDTSLT